MDKPEYIPIPRTGTKCPYCGLSRTGIYNLISPNKANGYKAVVKSSVVRLPGKKRGRRMVDYVSLMAHLKAQTVHVDVVNLRRPWNAFRAQLCFDNGGQAPCRVDAVMMDDLPDDAVLPEK